MILHRQTASNNAAATLLLRGVYEAMDGGVIAILANVGLVVVLAIAFFMMRRQFIHVHTQRLRELAAPLLGTYVIKRERLCVGVSLYCHCIAN